MAFSDTVKFSGDWCMYCSKYRTQHVPAGGKCLFGPTHYRDMNEEIAERIIRFKSADLENTVEAWFDTGVITEVTCYGPDKMMKMMYFTFKDTLSIVNRVYIDEVDLAALTS